MTTERDASLLSRALHCLHDAVALVDLDKRIRYANPALEELVGAGREGLRGRPIGEVLEEGAPGGPPLSLAGRTVRRGTLLHRTGERIPVTWSALLLSDPEQGPYTTYTFHDLRPELRLERLEERLRHSERLTILGEVFGGIAHEIRNPLSNIVMSAELLLRDQAGGDRTRLAAGVRDAAMRCSEILGQVLGFVRKPTAPAVRQSLSEAVREIVDFVARPFALSGIAVEFDAPADLPLALFDRGKIQQVVTNLLQNARDALLEAGRGGTIRVQVSDVGQGRLGLRIADDGPGVPAELLPRISEAFFTTKPEGKGTGLGLSIAKTLVEEHGGRLTLGKAAEGGLEIAIALPVDGPGPRTEAATALAPHRSFGPRRSEDPLDGMRVLAIDDEPEWLEGVKRCFLTMGAAMVDTARDADQALARLARNRYDLVVCDVRLPGMSGTRLYELVARSSPGQADRFLFVTGYPDDGDLDRLDRPFGRVGKPCDLAALHSAAREVLDRAGRDHGHPVASEDPDRPY